MMLLGSYAVTLVHIVSGGLVTLLNGTDLAAKRGADRRQSAAVRSPKPRVSLRPRLGNICCPLVPTPTDNFAEVNSAR